MENNEANPFTIAVINIADTDNRMAVGNTNKDPSHRDACAQNLQTRGLENDSDVTLVPNLCASPVGIYQINLL